MSKKPLTKGLVAVSGGFDPVHIGHMRLFKEARKLGKKLVIILNNDNWLMDKKGFVFMTQGERKELLLESGLVDKVVITSHVKDDADRSVNRELKAVLPEIFANGGDRGRMNIPELELCEELGIKAVFNVGKGGKVQSSSWLTNHVAGTGVFDRRPWGYERIFRAEKHYWLKLLVVSAGKRLSLQSHKHRAEHWVCVEGEVQAEIDDEKRTLKVGESAVVPPGAKHRLSSTKGGMIAEIAYGSDVNESDLTRYEDDFGRE